MHKTRTLTTLLLLLCFATAATAQRKERRENLSSLNAWRNFKSPTINEKWKQNPKGFMLIGKVGKGYIALQDHSDQVWFRNIRTRSL